MEGFRKSIFLNVDIKGKKITNSPINMNRVRYFFKNNYEGFRIIFKTEGDTVTWTYPDEIARDFEHDAMCEDIYDASNSFNYEDYRAEVKEQVKEVLESTDIEKEVEQVFIYRKDDKFFVSRNEWKVKQDNSHYEKGILL